MPYRESAEFQRTSPVLVHQDFPEFIDSAINAGSVGPENASRLLAAWPMDIERPDRALREIVRSTNHGRREVIAASLRTFEDFIPGEVFEVRLHGSGSKWFKGEITSSAPGQVTLGLGGLEEVRVPAYHPALFRPEEKETMDGLRRGPGFETLARFIIKLSYFDKRLAGHEKFIRSTARMFGATVERIPKSLEQVS